MALTAQIPVRNLYVAARSSAHCLHQISQNSLFLGRLIQPKSNQTSIPLKFLCFGPSNAHRCIKIQPKLPIFLGWLIQPNPTLQSPFFSAVSSLPPLQPPPPWPSSPARPAPGVPGGIQKKIGGLWLLIYGKIYNKKWEFHGDLMVIWDLRWWCLMVTEGKRSNYIFVFNGIQQPKKKASNEEIGLNEFLPTNPGIESRKKRASLFPKGTWLY